MTIAPRPHCPVARTAEMLGDKWSLLILRSLTLDGPHRFQDFVNAFPGISPTTLSNRLKSLQTSGLISREVTDGHPPRTRYELTELGLSARPIIGAMRAFGMAHLTEGEGEDD